MTIKIEQLETILQAHDKLTQGMATVKEVKELSDIFLRMVSDIKKYVEKVDADMAKKFDTLSGKAVTKALDDLTSNFKRFEKDLDKNFTNTINELSDSFKELKDAYEKQMDSLMSNHKKSMGSLEALMPELKEHIESIDTVVQRHNEMEAELAQLDSSLELKSKETKDEIKQINESLRELLSKIDKEFKKSLDELKKEVASKSSGGVRRVFQPYIDRFSSETDGVTKTFYLRREPLRTDTIEVSGTDFPIILDPTVDFTVTGRTLTLSANIPAPSQGATLIVKYYA